MRLIRRSGPIERIVEIRKLQNIMCLAIPGKLIEIRDENGLRMGTVDISGTLTKACLEYVPEILIGQYTIVHAGFALKVIDEDEAAESLKLWDELIRAQGEG